MRDNLIATGLQDDPDPDGVDTDGMLALYTEVENDSEGEEDRAVREDRKEGRRVVLGGKGGDKGGGGDGGIEEDESTLSSPASFAVDVPEDAEFTDDENAYQAMTSRDGGDLAPGEAQALINYMRPMSDEEVEASEDPLLRDIRRVDDTVHTDNVLRAGKNGKGIDKYLNDATFGERMPTSEELAERTGSDNDKGARVAGGWGFGEAGVGPAVPGGDKIAAWFPSASGLSTVRRANRQTRGRWTKGKQVSPAGALIRQLHQQLKAEHANFLADADLTSNIAVRPRSFYENVGRLWTRDILRKANISRAATLTVVQAAVQKILADTQAVRSSYSKALSSSGMEGWGLSLSSITHTVSRAAKGVAHAAEKGAGMAYKYSGAKFVVNKAQDALLYPIRKVIRSQTNKIVNKRAQAVAKTQGLAKPTPLMYSQAKIWAKNVVRSKNKVYGPVIASLMGAEYGVQEVDISLGGGWAGRGQRGQFGGPEIPGWDDMGAQFAPFGGFGTTKTSPTPASQARALVGYERGWAERGQRGQFGGPEIPGWDDMGAGAGDIASLLVKGPFYVLNFLGDILKMPMGLISPKGPTAAPAPGDGAPADGSQDPGAGDPGAGDPGAGDPGAGAPGGAADAGPADAGDPGDGGDSSGYGPYTNQWSLQPAFQQVATAMSPASDVPTISPRHPRMGYARRLHRKLRNEHTNFLADADLTANITVRPKSYYDNVSRLWARDIFRQANIPWSSPMATVKAAVQQMLNSTQSVRASYSKALGTPYTGTLPVATPYGAQPAAQYPTTTAQQYPGAPFVSYPGQPAPYNPYAGSPGRPGGYVPGSDSEDEDFGDSSGAESYVIRTLMAKYPQGVTLEQINQEPKQVRQIILALVRQSRIKIRH
jgi:hypothetical protein